MLLTVYGTSWRVFWLTGNVSTTVSVCTGALYRMFHKTCLARIRAADASSFAMHCTIVFVFLVAAVFTRYWHTMQVSIQSELTLEVSELPSDTLAALRQTVVKRVLAASQPPEDVAAKKPGEWISITSICADRLCIRCVIDGSASMSSSCSLSIFLF